MQNTSCQVLRNFQATHFRQHVSMILARLKFFIALFVVIFEDINLHCDRKSFPEVGLCFAANHVLASNSVLITSIEETLRLCQLSRSIMYSTGSTPVCGGIRGSTLVCGGIRESTPVCERNNVA